jgi:hypothetical protein
MCTAVSLWEDIASLSPALKLVSPGNVGPGLHVRLHGELHIRQAKLSCQQTSLSLHNLNDKKSFLGAYWCRLSVLISAVTNRTD